MITDWTEGARRLKGYVPEEVVGRHISMFHTPDDRARGEPERTLEEAARTGRSERESWHVRRDGTWFWANEIATPIRTESGTLVGFTRISRDLTLQREIEQEREAQLERERRARETAEVFATAMSHELRTPVTSIYGIASLIRKRPSRPDIVDLVTDMEAEAERLLRIVDDLLVLSRVERGSMELAPELLLVPRVIDEVLGAIHRRFPSVTFQKDIAGPLPTVLADSTATSQVLHNLLTNAAKYAGKDGPVLIRAMSQGAFVEVSVIDEGPGLGPDPDALFSLFYRSPHTATIASGTGIGLHVARELVKAMGGSMQAGTGPVRGATFRFTLPIGPSDE